VPIREGTCADGAGGAGVSPRPAGLRLILAYKAVKAAAELAAVAVVVALAASGRLAEVRAVARAWQEHVGNHLVIALGRALASLLSAQGLHWLELGLGLDALLSAFEGFTLWRGYAWAPWVVAGATAVPIPFELLQMLRRPRPSRVALLVLNAIVVAYLARMVARRPARGRQ
jgi:uncharacterized membrane protein (DUF2068 family)